MDWIDVKKQLPKLGRFYWIADNNGDVALAKWSMDTMGWKMMYMYKVIHPVRYMLEVKLPALPEPPEEE